MAAKDDNTSSAGSVMDWVVESCASVFVLIFLVGCHVLPGVAGHGRLLDPPSRSSMWRIGFSSPPNYDDNQLFCGGFSVQWERYGGKCGLCGDPWPGPRENEPGGKYANGIITRKYQVGQVIDVYVELTAGHKGYFEFRLCQNDNARANITQACLDRHLLVVHSTGNTRFPVPYSTAHDIRLQLRLPPRLTCSACVLQWKYNSGNSWGIDPVTNQGCIGCGPQEQFYGCSDVAIGRNDVVTGRPVVDFPRASTRRWDEAGGGGGIHRTNSVTSPRVSEQGGTSPSTDSGVATSPLPVRRSPESDSDWRYGIAYSFGDRNASRSAAARQMSGIMQRLVLCFVLMCVGNVLP